MSKYGGSEWHCYSVGLNKTCDGAEGHYRVGGWYRTLMIIHGTFAIQEKTI